MMCGLDLRTRVSLSSLQPPRAASAGFVMMSSWRIATFSLILHFSLQDSSRSPSVDGDILANHTHHHNQKRNSGTSRRHHRPADAKNSGSNNVQQTDESFHLLETGKNKSDNDDDDVAGNFRYEASCLAGRLNCFQMRR